MNRLRLAMGWAVVGAWVISFVLESIDRTYHTPQGLQVLATMVAGALFAPSIIRRKDNNDGHG